MNPARNGSQWLDVPLADYEGHMSAPGVEQLGALADLFAYALAARQPRSVAVLGVAGGNGLDRIDRAVTTRVAGIDIHPDYIEQTAERYPFAELHCADLSKSVDGIAPVELAHAALIFEHAGLHPCLDHALRLAQRSFSVVLQLPSTAQPGVSQTPYAAVRKLAEHFAFVDPEAFTAAMEARGFTPAETRIESLPGGKAFWLGLFDRAGAA